MSLLAALNLPVPKQLLAAAPKAPKSPGLPGAPGRQAAGEASGLADRDFPTDAKHRLREERAPKGPPGPAAKPKTEEPREDPDKLQAMVEEAIGDPAKRLEAMAKLKVPRFSAEFDDDDKEPLLAFLKEMESGTVKAREYIEYIQKMAEHAEKFGDISGLDRVGSAAGGLKKIAGQVGGGLKKWGGRIDTARQAARWFIELDKFADASTAMDPRNRESVKTWVGQMKRLWDATAPFAEWAHGEMVTAAFAGSRVAAVAGTTMSIVGAQLFIGLKVLDAGVKNVDAYLKRYEDIMRQIDIESGAVARPQVPPPPPYPGDWSTREEQRAMANAREVGAMRQAVQNAKDAAARRRAAAERAAAEKFDDELLPKLYVAARPKIVVALLAAMRKAGGKTVVIKDLKADARTPESRWWDCLLSDDSDPGRIDPQAGVWIHRPKGKVNLEEARFEVDNFLGVKPPYAPFAALREPARSQYIKAQADQAMKT